MMQEKLEHGHVIMLQHLAGGVVEMMCLCGEYVVGTERVVSAQILGHRLTAFPIVRARMP